MASTEETQQDVAKGKLPIGLPSTGVKLSAKTDSLEEPDLMVQSRIDSIALAKARLGNKNDKNVQSKSRLQRRSSFTESLTSFGKKIVRTLSGSRGGTPFSQSSVDALGITSKDKRGLEAFFGKLQQQREALLGYLGTEEGLEENVEAALNDYLSNLTHLLAPLDSGETPLKHGFNFVWNDVLCASRSVVVKSVEYEIGNALLSAALWNCNRAAGSMMFTEQGLSTASAAKSFQLYRRAIGMAEYAERLLGETPIAEAERTDVDQTVLKGIIHLLYAEIQGITVLRALEKDNAPSLISSLALEAQTRYEQASRTLSGIMSGCFLQKVHAYAAYKAACFQSYMFTYYAWAKLSGSSGGVAVRLAKEAESVYDVASDLGLLYDRTPPLSRSTDRDTFHRTLQKIVTKAVRQTDSDNRHVYYERVPTDLPELPQPKHLVGSVVFEFPAVSTDVERNIFDEVKTARTTDAPPATVIEIVPGSTTAAATVDGIEEPKVDKKEGKKGLWWRWLLVLISLPLLLMFTLLGVGIWIILIPIKFFCWPLGMLAQFLWNVVEYLIKAPLRAMKWAAGEPWQPVKPETGNQ